MPPVFFIPFCVGLVILSVVVTLYVSRWRVRRHRASLDHYRMQIHEWLDEAVEAYCHIAEVELRGAFLIKEIPPEYWHPIYQGMKLGRAVKFAMLKEARRRGLLHTTIDTMEEAANAVDDEAAAEPPEESSPSMTVPFGSPPIQWDAGGRPVPRHLHPTKPRKQRP